ncbi:hypothetical protein Sme01_30790 [Sphaerisporangium melleum]|uniref:Uncharacterized protein n=1 Tax=Sphaerisporangium melleum TaxID=321316 RepID=A0A917R8C3_9ACTN|nr:hypothetical protein GCM10007964_42220 [Sphaerisporangium melleum]GII70603.1 hypothetical protein Sme01_30790 [Sphaerisporangium melleum]
MHRTALRTGPRERSGGHGTGTVTVTSYDRDGADSVNSHPALQGPVVHVHVRRPASAGPKASASARERA